MTYFNELRFNRSDNENHSENHKQTPEEPEPKIVAVDLQAMV